MTFTRRRAVKTIVGAGALAPMGLSAAGKTPSPSNRLNLACVGVGGKGWDDMIAASGGGERHNVVAICDIDHRHGGEQPPNLAKGQAARPLGLGAAAKKFPKAKGHSSVNYRTAVEVIRSGVIGKIREVHAWTRSPSWPQGIPRPAGSDPVPEGVHWDLWLAVAEPRPYVKHAYHNFNWRGWKEFGTGALGDMGCHVMDPAVWSLKLGPPKQVSAKVSGPSDETYPRASTVSYQFAGTASTTGDLALHWHDGGNNPPGDLAKIMERIGNGTLYLGEKGTMLLPHGNSIPRFVPREDFLDYSQTTLKEIYQGYADEKLDHYKVWTDAILEGKQANSHFGYAAPLNETVMIGTVAQRLPERTLAWNAAALSFDDAEATALVRRPYRKGWEIEALQE